ncbi:hypothetical protein CSB37_02700 [bacterium DOLZORAL124_38_8]|nr:MAG: hypothetical protein CSB37_02700 [bacterium DOLZORAL124_38_8]
MVSKDIISGDFRNKVNKEILKDRLMREPFERTTISFYRYVNIGNPEKLRNKLWLDWTQLQVFGRIYVAKEGINAQLSVPTYLLEDFRAYIDATKHFKNVPFKIAVEDDGKSFYKLDIKVRKKLVADGLDDNAFDTTNVGKHLTAKEFNEILKKEDSICFDMRNNYEGRIGHFDGAICPDVETFREELPVVLDELKDKPKDKPVLLYCTGGIRCEKASAFLRHHGFTNVGQLHGGIIDYAHQVKRENLDNNYKGKNYVFDGRVAEAIGDECIAHCDQCGVSADSYVNCNNKACNELFIQCAECNKKMDGCCSEKCKEINALPEEEQKKLRKGYRHTRHVRPACCCDA